MAEKRVTKKDKLSVKGRDGWRFLLRDEGQRVSVKDYAEIDFSRNLRPAYKYKTPEQKKKHYDSKMDALLALLKAGKYIYGDYFVMLCRRHGIWMTKYTKCQLQYMNCIDVSIRCIRHRNERGDFERKAFNGVFTAIEKLLAETM